MPEIVGRLRPPRTLAAPGSPAKGEIYYDTTPEWNGLWWWDGTEWIDARGGRQIPFIYSITAGYTQDRILNPQATSLGEVAAVLGTLIDDLKAAGLITTTPP